jgi:uncharacterized protein (DUF885 family)
MTAVFDLCDDYVTRWAALDPVAADVSGVVGQFGAGTDCGPDGEAARAELVDGTLSRLAALPVTGPADRQAADYLGERLAADAAWYRSDEPLRSLRGQFGLVNLVRDSVDLLPRGGAEDWRKVVARLAAIPGMLAGWRTTLDLGLDRGLPAARRQAVEAAAQSDRYAAGAHQPLLAEHGDGELAGELAAAVAAAHGAYADIARYLRTEYAPRATETDAVGPERYALAARLSLGADLDPVEAYQWGWAELARIEAELAAEAGRTRPGASVEEATELLDQTQYVDGADAYLGWLQERHDWAIDTLGGQFDIPPALRTVEVRLATGSTAGSPYYTPLSEDLTRPGRTWWPLGGRDRFAVWSELTTVFHEGVPGHHLEAGISRLPGTGLTRFAKARYISGHGEGWALYAERLADELGMFTVPGSRLGMLAASALRAARVVIDIGVHLDLPLPDGSRWTFDRACAVLRDRGRAAPHRVHAEVVRYCGWPAQAISYKLGERAWLAARAEARARPGFDLRRWHTAALSLGPIGLDGLAAALRGIG